MAVSTIKLERPIKNLGNTNVLGGDVLNVLKSHCGEGITLYTASNNPSNRPTNNQWGAYVVFKRENTALLLSLSDYGIAWASINDIKNATEITWNYPCPNNS